MLGRRITLCTLLAVACARQERIPPAPEPEEWTRVIPNPFESSQLVADDYTHVVTQVVDAVSGEPIPGATLSLVEDFILSGNKPPVVVARAATDEFGIVRARADEAEWGLCFIEAPGYAPFVAREIDGLPVMLTRGSDIRLRVVDSLGRPAPGVVAQYYYGAGGEPNARQPVTDANGEATLRCIDPAEGLLFPVSAAVAGEDVDLQGIPEFDGVRILHGSPGGVVEGRVVDAQGSAIEGARVYAHGWNHGPWALTDATGAFRVVGIERFDRLVVDERVDSAEPLAQFQAPPLGIPVVVRPGWANERTERVEIALRLAGDPAHRPDDVEVCAVRRDDGRTDAGHTNGTWGGVYLDLPAGRWQLRVGGEVGPYVETRTDIEVRAGVPNAFEIPVQLWPEVAVTIPKLQTGWGIVLTSRYDERWLTDEETRDGLVRLPRDRDLALRVVHSGASVAGYPGGLIPIPKGEVDGVVLNAPPQRTEWDSTPFFLREREPADEHDGTLTLVDADGNPIAGAAVTRRSRNAFDARHTDENGQAPGGPEGGYVEVCAEREDGYWIPLRRQFEGKGPWTFRFGKCAVRIEIRGAEGEPCAWYGLFPDGDAGWGVEEDIDLYGFEPGLYRILACAPGTKGVVRQFRLTDEGLRTIRITLPAAGD